MANKGSGNAIGCLVTYPGSGVDFTSGIPSRIRPIYLYDGPNTNPQSSKMVFSDIVSNGNVANPQQFVSPKGWWCRSNVMQNNNPSGVGYTSGNIGAAVGFPDSAANPHFYSISHSVYWQGSERGNCLTTPYANISNPDFNDFQAAVLPSAANYDPTSSDPIISNIRSTYDIWKVEINITSDLDQGSSWINSNQPDPQYPAGLSGSGGVNHIISYWDDYGNLGAAGAIGDTKVLLNAGISMRLWR